jgi:nitrogen fixation/metabolism regulation signal transduction histidine kinase
MFLLKRKKKSERPFVPPSAKFEGRLFYSILRTGVPAAALALVLLWVNPYSIDHKIEGTVLLLLLWLSSTLGTRNHIIHSIRVLSNVIASLKDGDLSFRATHAIGGDALGDLALEINNLARALESERLGAIEATNLLRKILFEVDAVIFAFSPDNRVRLLNRAATAFLRKSEEESLNRTAEELGILHILNGPPSETISQSFAGTERRWVVQRTSFRQQGIPHRLVMLSEVSEALRAEERLAWQRIVRVLSHEINNSLAPIKSIAHTLARLSATTTMADEARENFQHGLEVIKERTEALNRFLQNYTRLARLPAPVRQVISLNKLVSHVAGLEFRLKVRVLPGPDVKVNVDPDQLEQVLINLTRNALEAMLDKPAGDKQGPAVTLSWHVTGRDLDLFIRDQGPGLLDTANLFVPFYTTKKTGTGIGLLLSRNIIEAHGGRLSIRNREDCSGCEVQIKIPNCITAELNENSQLPASQVETS